MFDDHGIRLTPSHTKKGARRYRHSSIRIPARELENAVVAALAGLLRDESRLMGLMKEAAVGAVKHNLQSAGALASRLDSGSASNQLEVLKQLLSRITIRPNSIEIAVRTAAIWRVDSAAATDAVTTVSVPAQLKRCGLAVRLIVRAAGMDKARAQDPKLLSVLTKAQSWFEELRSGRRESVLSIAKEHDLQCRDVTRIIYLAFLDSDIVQRITRGKYPVELNMKRLLAAAPLPMDWREQRLVLGFEP